MRQNIFTIILSLASPLIPGSMKVQRIQQPLGRGVVAVAKSSTATASMTTCWCAPGQ